MQGDSMNLPPCRKGLGFLMLTLGFSITTGCDEKHPRVAESPPLIVLVALPIERDVTDHEIFTARTQAVESVDIKARVTGYLTNILFKDGAEVKKDQVLFKIDDRPYKDSVEKAKADVEIAKAALVRAQAFYDIGVNLQKQDIGAVSAQELVRRKAQRDEAVGSVKLSEANLNLAQLYLGWCTVTAPITGRINKHAVDVGGLVTQDVTVLTNVVSLKPIWAYFDVDENTAVRYQQLVLKGEVKSVRQSEIAVQMSLQSDTQFPFQGVIDFMANQADPNTGSVRLRAVFPNDNDVLVAGQFGRVRVPIGPAHQALLVLDSAIGTDQGRRFLLVANDKNEVEYRAVDVGEMHGELREVKRYRTVTETSAHGAAVKKQVEVLRASDRVIVEGLQRSRPGAKVEPRLVEMATLLPVRPGAESGKTAPKSN
jgi:RND family efflux transporter MFP subunit